ncbi:hypothetical protein BJX61DRAFT_527745 [Aspergillus egyptiacus]|nr:hypothetical protein BJX61DRAFT_527745 [Aspergillus egyptiacus]
MSLASCNQSAHPNYATNMQGIDNAFIHILWLYYLRKDHISCKRVRLGDDYSTMYVV